MRATKMMTRNSDALTDVRTKFIVNEVLAFLEFHLATRTAKSA